jgi:hypothetical protein
VLDQSEFGHAWAEYLRHSRIQIAFHDALGGPGGTTWLGWRVVFPNSMRTYLEPDRLVHELVHTTQGPYIFGSLEHERAAYIVQYRYLAETADARHARDFYHDIAANLQRGGDEAYAWVKEQGPYYHAFPIENPKLWQVRQWAPQVAYALNVAVPRLRGNVRQG